MASTIKFGRGHADASVSIGTDNLNSGETTGDFVSGPPSEGQRFHRGIYGRQSDAGDDTFRWLYDEATPGTASPTTYQYMQRANTASSTD